MGFVCLLDFACLVWSAGCWLGFSISVFCSSGCAILLCGWLGVGAWRLLWV